MLLNNISEQMISGRAPALINLVNEALQNGISASDIINNGLISGMNTVGERFRNNEIFIPEVMMAARAMKLAMEVLKPCLKGDENRYCGTVVIGTVKGDQHDIGKNLVAIMLESKGFRVVDLGTNVTPEQYIEAAKIEKADIIACSALLTTTMQNMKSVIELVKNDGLKCKVIVGGAPVSKSFADSIGADGYSSDAASAAELAFSLIA